MSCSGLDFPLIVKNNIFYIARRRIGQKWERFLRVNSLHEFSSQMPILSSLDVVDRRRPERRHLCGLPADPQYGHGHSYSKSIAVVIQRPLFCLLITQTIHRDVGDVLLYTSVFKISSGPFARKFYAGCATLDHFSSVTKDYATREKGF
ncbi:hypothetical protein AGDE_14783 [Angomonas deanei]|uniref:Uncharacterized protein n=1 Tax=Angomonas deanei TaxID=59799 RepID=A0A7G2CDM9_9TRYP|nr:hypothetical protein AGDE_14783 [Angomonas deanei]CAD2216964.1 hypothetical protein, conserved [Angomonas deanei]|eukprot:EPY20234.1 hypothetical protein AGDE_14783 [Angomonas deanei]